LEDLSEPCSMFQSGAGPGRVTQLQCGLYKILFYWKCDFVWGICVCRVYARKYGRSWSQRSV